MAEISEYKEWLASAPTDRGVLETIEVHQAGTPSIFLANWDVNVDCTLEDVSGQPVQTFLASRFSLQPAQIEQSTEQVTTLVIAAYDGLVYQAFKELTPAQRQLEIMVTPRLYWTNDQTKLLMNPPPSWNIHSVTAGLEAVQVELSATPLRVHRTGIYYTALQFPVLGIGT